MPTTDTHPPLQSNSTLLQMDRKQRLQRIVRKGLPPFRQTALELMKILGGASPDLKKAGKLICADPALSSQVLRACNSPLLGLRSRVVSIEHAATLLGPERLRGLALTTSMADFASKALSEQQMNTFWQHSFMAAMLSQYLAERREYFEKDQAYIAGLLHDIGQVPEWILLFEDHGKPCPAPPNWVDNPRVEHNYFGIDHCKLGGVMARFWDLMPSFLDVIENHHTPDVAQHDSILVRIVATIEYFLLAKSPVPTPEDGTLHENNAQQFRELGKGLFGEIEWPYVEEALEEEYRRILPMAKAGLKGVLGRSDSESERDSERVPEQAPVRDSKPIVILDEASSRALDLKLSRPPLRAQATRARILSQPVESGSWLSRLFSKCTGKRKK